MICIFPDEFFFLFFCLEAYCCQRVLLYGSSDRWCQWYAVKEIRERTFVLEWYWLDVDQLISWMFYKGFSLLKPIKSWRSHWERRDNKYMSWQLSCIWIKLQITTLRRFSKNYFSPLSNAKFSDTFTNIFLNIKAWLLQTKLYNRFKTNGLFHLSIKEPKILFKICFKYVRTMLILHIFFYL